MVTYLDDILINFSVFSRYYVTLVISIGITLMFNCMYSNNYVFSAMEVKYRCVDRRFGNNSCGILSNTSEHCTEWEYDNPLSFMAEFDLACQEWKRTLLGTVHSFGYMIGLLFIGPIADRLGRKPVCLIAGLLEAVIGVTKSFSPYYWMYLSLEFLDAALGAHSSPSFTLSIEIVSCEKRVLYIMLSFFGYAVGFATLPLAAWAVPYWRYMLRAVYGPAIIYVILFFTLDESPRWLLSKGRKEKAVFIIKKMAKINKVELDDKDFDDLAYEEIKSVKMTQLLKETLTSNTLFKRVFICITWWTTNTFVSYGLQINSVTLPGNKYVNFSLLCLTEVIGVLCTGFLLSYFNRKMPLACSYILTSLFIVCQSFVHTDVPWLSVLLFMIGKVMAVICFTTTYIYTAELFPTYTRNSMHSLCSSMGRFGSIIAPQTPLLIPYWQGLPSLTCGIVSLVAGLVTLLAPNTTDDSLPDTIQQAEAIGLRKKTKKQKKNIFSLRRKEREESKNGENSF